MVQLYFVYGSLLLTSRMQVQKPTPKRVGIARLDNHRLEFFFESGRWGGHTATIVPAAWKKVWGALWEVTDVDSLDRQEGVADGIYKVVDVDVTKPNGEVVRARSYQLINQPGEGEGKLPSRIYLETILQGAKESELPADYLKELKAIHHNGFEGPVEVPGINISFVETTPN